jgi:hypothetical protein
MSRSKPPPAPEYYEQHRDTTTGRFDAPEGADKPALAKPTAETAAPVAKHPMSRCACEKSPCPCACHQPYPHNVAMPRLANCAMPR